MAQTVRGSSEAGGLPGTWKGVAERSRGARRGGGRRRVDIRS